MEGMISAQNKLGSSVPCRDSACRFEAFLAPGATISAGMLMGVMKSRVEAFSFALAVVLTPAAVGREAIRLMQAERAGGTVAFASAAFPSVLGAVFAFLGAGCIAVA